jgi:hypothetical protein
VPDKVSFDLIEHVVGPQDPIGARFGESQQEIREPDRNEHASIKESGKGHG